MERYQQSDSEAASLLVNQLSPQIFHYYLAQVRNRSQAEDLLQEFWLRIHNARHTYRPGEPLLPWVFAIARRSQIDQYRKTRRISQHEIAAEQLPDVPAHQPGTNLPALPELLAALPRAQRETVVMLKVTGLSLEEVARATGTTVGAVKQKAHRAYATLRKLFGSEV